MTLCRAHGQPDPDGLCDQSFRLDFVGILPTDALALDAYLDALWDEIFAKGTAGGEWTLTSYTEPDGIDEYRFRRRDLLTALYREAYAYRTDLRTTLECSKLGTERKEIPDEPAPAAAPVRDDRAAR